MTRPVVLVVTRRTVRKSRLIDYVGELHLGLLIRLRTLPLMIPVVENVPACLPQYMEKMKGLLVVEGEDIEPRRYRAQPANFTHVEKTHPLKDAIEIRLMRHALRHSIPILGICRGSQLLNVVNGGTLYGDVRKEIGKGSRQSAHEKNSPAEDPLAKAPPLMHIEQEGERYDTYRHRVTLVDGTPLRRWYGRNTMQVNSYHHQGVRDLAGRFKPMAHADDGLVEAFYDPQAEFLVGLQFHPERMLPEHVGNWRVWQAFGAAIHRRARKP